MAWQRMKPTLVFYPALIIVFYVFNSYFLLTIVAVLPFNISKVLGPLVATLGEPINHGFGLRYIGWYPISGMALNMLIQKLMGLRFEGVSPDTKKKPSK